MTLHFLLLACAAATAAAGNVHLHDDGMDLYWKLEENDTVVVINMTCPSTTQYCSVGLGESMSEADTVLCSVVEANGTVVCYDGSVTGHRVPAQDVQGDVAVESFNVDGSWSVVFKRAVDTEDVAGDQKFNLNGLPQSIIWAVGDLDSTGSFSKHGRSDRGIEKVVWRPMAFEAEPREFESGVGMAVAWEVRVDASVMLVNVTCPRAEVYCAVGLEGEGFTDVLLCYLEDGAALCVDGVANATGVPAPDGTSDVTVIAHAVAEDGSWSVLYRRFVSTADDEDVGFFVNGAEQRVTWAIGTVTADAGGVVFQNMSTAETGELDVVWRPFAFDRQLRHAFHETMELEWELIEDRTVIAINMTCGSEYCAIGLGEDMSDADTMTCWKPLGAESVTCSDGHVTRHRAPAADAQQDLTIISSVTNGNGTWSVVFTRRVASADPADKQFTIDATPQAIIWANGSVSDGSLSRHGSSDRGFAAIAWSRVHLDDPQHEALGEGIDLRWELKEGRSFVAVNLTCPSLDNWCGLGIGEEAAGVDTVLCWMTASMEAVCEDGHIAAGLQISVADGQQDVAVILHELQPDGSWSVLFTKPVHTGDGNDTTVTVNGQSQSIVWATGANDAAKEYLFADGSSTVYWHLIAFEHPSRHELSADGMVLTWELMEEKQLIAVDMSCPSTSSYCAMGLGDDMYGADTVLCWFNESTEEAFCKDGFVNGHTEPTPDASQDVVVISWASADGGWSVFFTRKTTTADSLKDAAFETRPGVAQPIIWAFGGIGEDGKVSRHARSTRGMSAVAWDPMQLVDELSQELFDGMTISWVLHDGSGEDSWIAVNMTCPSAEKYCAIGLGVDMYGSDVITCWVADEFVGVECQDGWVNDHESPTADDQQDCTVLHSEINADGSWSVLFTRAVATGDASDVALTVNGQAQSVIFASGGYNNGTYSKHRRSTRGVTSVTWRPLLLLNPHHIELAQGMDLYWQLRDQSTSIIVNLSCPSAQYFCAIGLGHDMDDADTMLCWVNGTEVACIDGAVTGHRAPLADEQQDLVVITSTVESDDSWSVVFTRAVNTSDPSDKQFVTNGQQQGMIWAYGNHTDGTPSKHRRDTRGGLALAWKPISLADPQHLDLAAGMDLQWELFDDYSLIAINMTCPSTDSYCAIGLGKDMSDADTVICWVADDAVKCSDGTVSRHRAPAADAQQDYVVLAYEVAVDDSWSVFLARAVDTGDAADKPFVVDSGKQPVIWAHGPNVNGSFSRHERDTRGAVDVAWRRLFLSDPHHVGLAGGMGLSWQLFEEDSFIAIEMTCPSTEQYCAIGLGEDMDDADTILCWLDDNTANCSDGFVTGHDKPTADAQQDVSIVTSQVSADGTWSVLFTRAVNSSDAGDKAFVVDGRTQPFIWAFGSYGAGSFGRHKRSTRGASGIAWKPLTLVDPQHVELATGMDLYWQIIEGGTVIAFNMTCPAADTEKYCSFGLGESMDDADTVLCWADDTAVSCKDGSVSGHHEPVTDDQQDFIVVSSAMQSDGSWSVLFTREVRSSDTTDKAFLVDGQKQPIIWAHGTYNNATFSRHKRSTRGQTAIAWKRLSLTNPQHMQAATGMTLYWELLEENTIVAINMSCPSDELYCAIGLGEDMDDADTLLCWVGATGVICSDGSVSGHEEPVADDQQDYVLIKSEISEDSWSVLLTRAVQSGDATDMAFIVDGQQQPIIWAYGTYNADDASFSKHKRSTRGATSIAWKYMALTDPVHLEVATDMHLSWQLMDDDALIAINMTCPSVEQYCAIGLGEDMDDADTIHCWMGDVAAVCSDGSVSGHAAPAVDDQQDHVVIASEVSPNGTWSVFFTRSVNSSDATDKAFVVNGQLQPAIWAYGTYNATADKPFIKHKRSTRGKIGIAWKPLILDNPRHIELAADVHLYWQVMEDETLIAINMTCPSTEQYCAFGLGQSMDDADTVLCRVDGGAAVCFDGSVSGHAAPVADDQQDYTFITSEVSANGAWSVLLTRPVHSSDPTDKAFVVDGQEQAVIWAFGKYSDGVQQHARSTRGAVNIAWGLLRLTNPSHVALAEGMDLYWEVMAEQSVIAINLTCPTSEQYCSFGLGQDMADADTVLCWVANAAVQCTDGSVVGHDAPAADQQQDYDVLAFDIAATGAWSVLLKRLVVSSDPGDKPFIIDGEQQQMIWAFGDMDSNGIPQEHSRRSKGSLAVAWGGEKQETGATKTFAEGMVLRWSVSDAEDVVTFNLTCPSTEMYCSFGLGEEMVNSDVFMCFARDGAATCTDSHVRDELVAPLADASQDLTVLEHAVVGAAWWVVFSRPVATADGADDRVLDVAEGAEPQAVIWAQGQHADGEFIEHEGGGRGMTRLAWADKSAVDTVVPATPIPPPTTPVPGASLHRLTDDFSASVELRRRDLSGKQRSSVALADANFPYTHVLLTFVCRVGQYCALGLSDDGTMLQSDAFVCWEHADGIRCVDWYCTSRATCPEDASQDLVVEETQVLGDGWFTVKVSRLLDTGDDKDRAIASENIDFIFANGPASAVSTPTTKHAAEGTAAINALTGTAEVTSDDDTVWIHILISLFLLTVLGLVSGIMIMVKPRFGYFFQQSAVGSVLSMVFIMCSLVTMSIGDYEHYRGRIVEYGVLFGGPAQICLALTLLVKVKMFSPCLFLMSVPQERALVWHRWIGRMGWLFVTLHGSLVIAEYRENNDGDASVLLHTELGTGGTTDGAGKVRPLYGIIAWVLYTVLVLLGLPAIRRIFYQAFVASHVVLSLCTLVFTILHLPDGWRTYAIFGLPVLLYVLDCLYRVYLSVHNSYILQHTNVGSVTKLTIVPPKPIKKWGPGSYFCVSIPQAGYMEYHPLSVTSHHSTKTATFYVKNMGPGTWTERLTQLPSEPKIELQAKLEGPYGKLSFDIDKHNNLILIAGGIGVTPMLSVIRYMDVAQEATLSWSVRDAELVQMLMDDLHELAARFKGLKVIVSFTGAGLDDVKFETERIAIVRGRPDYTALLVKNATEHSAVAICGPSGMIVGASDAVRRSPLRLPLHTETFEL
ncbi:Ferric reduction oxidase 4 [Diplonema papillatum]|nr:Ferric reduction oxidase 4 [Diplonema papillatum]